LPNSPSSGPIYRDASTLRSYPKLESYTAAQRSAHDANEDGNFWARQGDWVQALLNYQKASTQDPDGPFASVLKENIAIAIKHLEQERANKVLPASSTAASPPDQQEAQDKLEQVVESNCTGWMAQANGGSFRLCTDEQAHRYCEQLDGKSISRVSCQ